MSEIKPVPVERFDMGYSFYGQPEMQSSENGDYVEFAAYEALKVKVECLEGQIKLEQAKFRGEAETVKRVIAHSEALKAENEAQAKRIAELEEHITKLGAGSRQHLYQAFTRRYREILSLRRENEAQAKRIEEVKTFLAACVDDSMSRNNRQQLAGELLDMLNGDSK